MRRDVQKINQIALLAKLVQERNISELVLVLGEVKLIEEKLQLIDNQRAARHHQISRSPVIDLTMISGVDDLWNEHIERQEEKLKSEIKKLLNLAELSRNAAQVSVGRTEAFRLLSERLSRR